MKNKLPMMLLALACAVLIWLYDVTVVNPNDTSTISSIAVHLENEDAIQAQDLMITGNTEFTVSLRISGRRSELKKLTRTNIRVTADLSKITEAGTHELSYSVSYPANVSSGDLSIDYRSPAYVTVTVEHYISTPVEVRTVFEGETPPDSSGEYLVIDADAMEINPKQVVVTGPAELVATVAYARVVINRLDLTQTSTATYDYQLMDADGEVIERDELVTDCDKLSITIPVRKCKEVPLMLRTKPGGGATDENVSYTLSAESIMITGEPADVDRVRQIELGTLDYATVIGPTTKNYPVLMPEGVTNASGIGEVQVTVKITGLDITTLSMDTFELVNLAEGLSAEAMSQSVQLTLRGTPAALRSLDPEDIRITVDLSGFTQAGTFIVPVTVVLPTGLQVGAMGSNTVTVELQVESQ